MGNLLLTDTDSTIHFETLYSKKKFEQGFD